VNQHKGKGQKALTSVEFASMFGSFDEDSNGFSNPELLELADALDEMPNASEYMHTLGGDRQENEFLVTGGAAIIYLLILVANFWVAYQQEQVLKSDVKEHKQREEVIQQELDEKQRENNGLQNEITIHQSKLSDLTEKMKHAPSAEKAQLQEMVDEQKNKMVVLRSALGKKHAQMSLLNQDLTRQRAQWNKQMADRLTKMNAVFDCLRQEATLRANGEGATQKGATRGCNFEVGISLAICC
jgi:hypothetical protein